MKSHKLSGFTLIEILIVVVILGILASIIIVQVSGATRDTRWAAQSSTVQTLRNQITLYRIQHHDTNPTVDQLWDNLVSKTDEDGSIGNDAAHRFGPYVPEAPKNLYNSLSTVAAVPAAGTIPTSADLDINTVGFIYDSETGRIWATTGR